MIVYALRHAGRLLRETLAIIAPPTSQDGPASPTCAELSWPETWAAVPAQCPVCQAPTLTDRHIDSVHGPGWRCTCDASHYWRVRLNPLRRALAAHHQASHYPWYDTSPAERQAWLAAHSHLPRCMPEVGP